MRSYPSRTTRAVSGCTVRSICLTGNAPRQVRRDLWRFVPEFSWRALARSVWPQRWHLTWVDDHWLLSLPLTGGSVLFPSRVPGLAHH